MDCGKPALGDDVDAAEMLCRVLGQVDCLLAQAGHLFSTLVTRRAVPIADCEDGIHALEAAMREARGAARIAAVYHGQGHASGREANEAEKAIADAAAAAIDTFANLIDAVAGGEWAGASDSGINARIALQHLGELTRSTAPAEASGAGALAQLTQDPQRIPTVVALRGLAFRG